MSFFEKMDNYNQTLILSNKTNNVDMSSVLSGWPVTFYEKVGQK